MWSQTVWDATKGKPEFEKKYQKPHCIVLDSEYCSMGRMIGIKACERTGYTYYDALDLLQLANTEVYNKERLEHLDEKLSGIETITEAIIADEEFQAFHQIFATAIQTALKKGPCLIHERAFKDQIEIMGYSCISVMTYATDTESKLTRAKVDPKYKNLTGKTHIQQAIAKEDQKRKNYHNALSNQPWGTKETYDLLLNAEAMGMEKCIRLLAAVMED